MNGLPRSASGNELWLLAARILLASHFIFSGLEGVFRYGDALGFAAANGIPFAHILVAPANAVDLLGAALLISPRWCRLGAAILWPWTLFLGIWFHRFWAVPAAEWQGVVDNFFHHLVMAGGLLYVMLAGPGRLAAIFSGKGAVVPEGAR